MTRAGGLRRRDLIALAAAAPVMAQARTAGPQAGPPELPARQPGREYWVQILRRIADPVLDHLAAGTLKTHMPVEEAPDAKRAAVTHLEAFGRLMAGLAPWIELSSTSRGATAEGAVRQAYAERARRALARAVQAGSPDRLNFTEGRQPLVDAAFLAQAVLRAPHALWTAVDAPVRASLVEALESTRAILPAPNNWLLFSATVEAALARMGVWWDRVRVDYALRQHEQWYRGDGIYGDGPEFHWDYYNSFVIHPMLLDVLDAVGGESPAWERMQKSLPERSRRYAAILERLVAPDGTFPPIGRSIAYRCGAFQLLAQMALRRDLPAELEPGQVRTALGAVIRRTLEPPGTFDANGWLRIGLAGHQPGIGERYISTGSLYLCAAAFLPLGLAEDDPFWTSPARPTTSQRAWSGQAFPIDHAL